jgi:carboxylesterase
MNKIYSICLLAAIVFSCSEPDITDQMLDGSVVFDPTIYKPDSVLVSAKYPNPTAQDLEKHVILAIHGYSATTFEWKEFSDWSANEPYLVSQVLLGGHGSDYETFKASNWQDWSASIKTEYEKLIAQGYQKISLIGSSTGGTLLLELISSGYFNAHLSPKNIFLVDPLVVPSNKLQSIVGIVGPMLVYTEVVQTAEEDLYWYHFRPQETIQELNSVMKVVRKDLEKGVKLPAGSYFKVFHSKYDPVASTTSSVLIYKGLKTNAGGKVDVELIESKIHVFTRLALREDVTPLQTANQQRVFTEIASKLK